MEKRYTIQEFEKIYIEAQMKTIDDLMKSFKESSKEAKGKIDDSALFAFNIHNMMTMSELYKNIFQKKEK